MIFLIAAVTSKAVAPASAPPKTELVLGRKWSIENHTSNRNIIIDQTDPKQSVYIFNCSNCTIQVCHVQSLMLVLWLLAAASDLSWSAKLWKYLQSSKLQPTDASSTWYRSCDEARPSDRAGSSFLSADCHWDGHLITVLLLLSLS